jgi:hypothetical protein
VAQHGQATTAWSARGVFRGHLTSCRSRVTR